MRSLIAVVAAAGALLALAGPLAPGTAAAGCRPASNVEAIVDDSLSLEMSDPDRIRVQAFDLLLATLPARTTLGAVEFGSGYGGLRPPADQLFAPAPIGPNAAAMRGALRAKLAADNGTTDYNGAFALADSENPSAQARIFLTDGAHNEGEYANGHLAHNVPTYVIGFGSGLRGREDRALLERIAAETGGRYYRLADSSQLQAAINLVAARLTCEAPPRTFADRLAAGSAASHAVSIAGAARRAGIALTWADPRDRFRLTGLRLVLPGGARRARPLRVERSGGATFLLVTVAGLNRGRLQFSVEAVRAARDGTRPMLTTQVTLKRQQLR